MTAAMHYLGSDATRYTTCMLPPVGDGTLASWVWEGGPGMEYPEESSICILEVIAQWLMPNTR